MTIDFNKFVLALQNALSLKNASGTTRPGTFKTVGVESLIKASGNRLNSGWQSAEYIIINLADSTKKDDVLKGFGQIVGADPEAVKIQKLVLVYDSYAELYQYDTVSKCCKLFVSGGQDEILVFLGHPKVMQNDLEHNLIFFGAPGTGKSYKLNEESKYFDRNVSRVTFYPTYTYQQFFGAYKPSVDNDGNIIYSFVPGPFLSLLIKAYKSPEKKHLLIIEELNRANAPAVFGDIFQLLDRDSNGESLYSIALWKDLDDFLKQEFKDDVLTLNELTKKGLFLPSNFYIWATMNSADQGVFPLDTAFKRRWEFEYVDINAGEEKIKDYTVPFNDGVYRWNDIRRRINEKLRENEVNEDKLLGPFFLKLEVLKNEGKFKKAFKSKVLMYLFDDAMRHNPSAIFKEKDYSEICKKFDNGDINEIFAFDVPVECNNFPEEDNK